MKILVLNASPKGRNSVTVHTAMYLQALHPEHEFTFIPVGQHIRSYEKDFSPLRAELEKAEEIFMQGYNTTNDILERLLIDKGSIWKE